MKRTIHLWMWGYQEHFAHTVKALAERVFAAIGFEAQPQVFLVGIKRPDAQKAHPVCIEPEDDAWPLQMFDGLDQDVEAAIPNHEMQRMFYGDAPAMQDKPENIRRIVVREQVLARLEAYDRDQGVESFVAGVYRVGQHDVATVLQVPKAALESVPTLEGEGYRPEEPISANFVRTCIRYVLEEGRNELIQPDPGRSLSGNMRGADEVVRQAADSFMRNVSLLVDVRSHPRDLFHLFNQISSLMYEGRQGVGRIILSKSDNPALGFVLRLQEAVPLHQVRWARKLLEMASGDAALIAMQHQILGLGRLGPNGDPPGAFAFEVDFVDYYQWDLRHGEDLLLRSRYGEARLPQEPVRRERFEDNVTRLFTSAGPGDVARLWEMFRRMVRLPHGNMVVIAEDAAAEAARLSRQGTQIAPTQISEELLREASRIDGSILVDPQGVCHAVGVILDGAASDDCTPSRGARYNSAIRYIDGARDARMAVVVSDDKTVDIAPLLRPRLALADIEAALAAYETATEETYHLPRNFLEANRFYLDAGQCARANAALARMNAMPKEGIYIQTAPWTPHPDMNPSYLK